ncbi:MAG: glycoside hydrolase family 2 [Clostridia bacterium]|nr:glycoside hydrolase family 2 [Clostridia bacterium]
MLLTPEFIHSDVPLYEYPRPQMRRSSYLSLNGVWQYTVSRSSERPLSYQGEILVPYSPETVLSGVNREPLKAEEYLHYRRLFTLPEGFVRARVLLNVGACDQVCAVTVNGNAVGVHKGGYLPFSFDITSYLLEGVNEICFTVTDDASSPDYGRGKQKYNNKGIWYRPTSGIWQSVWLESVPETYIAGVSVTPDQPNKRVHVSCEIVGSSGMQVWMMEGEEVIAYGESLKSGVWLDASLCKEWTPDDPQLYRLLIQCGKDVVESYFGLRAFGTVEVAGAKMFAVNGKPVFTNALLDQGYYPDGAYTPPSNAFVFDQLKAVKALGFNALRKHAKVESQLWYYYCDLLGILVWQDMVNGGEQYPDWRIALGAIFPLKMDDTCYARTDRKTDRSREQYRKEAVEMQLALYNCTSLCVYTPFNEGWGQFDALKVCEELRAVDPTRLYDHASGWFDQGGGDFCSNHIYFRKARMKNDGRRILALTEFGGYSCVTEESANKPFGYKYFADKPALTDAFAKLYRKQILPLIVKQGLSVAVYTQLTDVEGEVNGMFTIEGVCKMDEAVVREVNEEVFEAFRNVCRTETPIDALEAVISAAEPSSDVEEAPVEAPLEEMAEGEESASEE